MSIIPTLTSSEAPVSLILVGGIKNALERGDTLQKARQSFISAGYKPEEVEAAIQRVPTKKLEAQNQMISASQLIQTKAQEFSQLPSNTKQSSSEGPSIAFKIILAIGVILILTASALLGLFWNKI
jgi:hypothetical protein